MIKRMKKIIDINFNNNRILGNEHTIKSLENLIERIKKNEYISFIIVDYFIDNKTKEKRQAEFDILGNHSMNDLMIMMSGINKYIIDKIQENNMKK